MRPELSFFGAGGPALARAGVEIRHPIDRLAVTGIVEAGARLGAAARVAADLWFQIRRRHPYLALLVDYPGLNLRLAGILRRAGVPVLYYVAPQRWAWLPRRTPELRRRIDRLAVTLPFEVEWFARHGVSAQFVGHPVLDLFAPVPRRRARAMLGLPEGERVVAVLPGSRANELRRHLPLLRATLARFPSIRPLLAVLPEATSRLCRELAPELPQTDAVTALGAADVALCAAGTATLETALAGVPAVVFYRTSALTFEVARRLVRVETIALPNLILGEKLLPELVQHQMTPAALADEVLALLDPQKSRRVRQRLSEVGAHLGQPGVAARVARLALPLLPRAHHPYP
jgi:lipid-A-disaccharide synthase